MMRVHIEHGAGDVKKLKRFRFDSRRVEVIGRSLAGVQYPGKTAVGIAGLHLGASARGQARLCPCIKDFLDA
jgi:hypothetical protein